MASFELRHRGHTPRGRAPNRTPGMLWHLGDAGGFGSGLNTFRLIPVPSNTFTVTRQVLRGPGAADTTCGRGHVALLKLKKCRSFRADLRHKLTLIIRAHGGYGHRGIEKAAEALGVARQTLWKWVRWNTVPKTRVGFERIDRGYSESLEKLVAEKLKRKRKRKRKCAGSNATASPVTG